MEINQPNSSEHLNENKYVSNIEYQESEMVSDIADAIGYWMTVVEDVTLADKYLSTLNEPDIINLIIKNNLVWV